MDDDWGYPCFRKPQYGLWHCFNEHEWFFCCGWLQNPAVILPFLWEIPYEWRFGLESIELSMGDFHFPLQTVWVNQQEFDPQNPQMFAGVASHFPHEMTKFYWYVSLYFQTQLPIKSPKKRSSGFGPGSTSCPGTRRSSLSLPMVALALVARFGNSAWRMMWVKYTVKKTSLQVKSCEQWLRSTPVAWWLVGGLNPTLYVLGIFW